MNASAVHLAGILGVATLLATTTGGCTECGSIDYATFRANGTSPAELQEIGRDIADCGALDDESKADVMDRLGAVRLRREGENLVATYSLGQCVDESDCLFPEETAFLKITFDPEGIVESTEVFAT